MAASPETAGAHLGDWRLDLVVYVPEAQEVAYLTTTYRTKQGQRVSFAAPSAAALHMNAAWRAAGRAAAALRAISMKISKEPNGEMHIQVAGEETSKLFDYFEEAATVAMLAGGAIEAFCNHVIARLGTAPIVNPKNKKRYSLEDAERNISIADKIETVLPLILGVESPKGKSVWDAFERVKDFRNRVTHFKRNDVAKTYDKSDEPTVLYSLWMSDCHDICNDARAVMEYFCTDRFSPRWIENPSWDIRG